jgi:hypothetical protein
MPKMWMWSSQVADFRKIVIAELWLRSNIFLISCWIGIAEVLPSSCGIAIADSKKKLLVPTCDKYSGGLENRNDFPSLGLVEILHYFFLSWLFRNISCCLWLLLPVPEGVWILWPLLNDFKCFFLIVTVPDCYRMVPSACDCDWRSWILLYVRGYSYWMLLSTVLVPKCCCMCL